MAVDTTVLVAQLADARRSRDHLDRVIAWLEEGVELFAGTTPAGELEAPREESLPTDDPPAADPPPCGIGWSLVAAQFPARSPAFAGDHA